VTGDDDITIVYTPDGGEEQKEPLRVDPSGPAGAPQMTIGQVAYDPCT
jgi:hypothetical protein